MSARNKYIVGAVAAAAVLGGAAAVSYWTISKTPAETETFAAEGQTTIDNIDLAEAEPDSGLANDVVMDGMSDITPVIMPEDGEVTTVDASAEGEIIVDGDVGVPTDVDMTSSGDSDVVPGEVLPE